MSSTVTDPASARPARVVGLVLMAIAFMAVVLGVITLIDGGENSGGGGANSSPPDTPPATATTVSQPGEPGQSPPVSPPPASPPTGQPGTPAPTGAAPPQPPPQPPPPNPRAVPVRVFNNGTITGLAAQAARDFRANGWNVVEVGNYSQGIIPTTTVYFRPGTEEEAAARELGARFNMRVEPRFPGIANSSAGLIVLITNDYGGK